MVTPKMGLPGQEVLVGGPGTTRAATVTLVNGDGTVNSRHIGGTTDKTNLPFVDVGATPPAGVDYFQAIDCAS
jgi:hypothetical protein